MAVREYLQSRHTLGLMSVDDACKELLLNRTEIQYMGVKSKRVTVDKVVELIGELDG